MTHEYPPKICERCGSLDYYEIYNTSGTENRSCAVERDGSVSDEWGNNDSNDSEASGDEYCSNCSRGSLLDLSELSQEQLARLYATPQGERLAAAQAMLDGASPAMPEQSDNMRNWKRNQRV